jgi:MFS family permease
MQLNASQLGGNVWKIMVIIMLRSFMLIMPIAVPFFQENGLTLQQVLWIQSLFWLTVVLFEVPSGYVADVWGRRKAILLGCIFAVFGLAVYAVSYDFWWFLAAEMILGIGVSFISGADSALLYDTLIQLQRAGEYKRMQGRLDAVSRVSEGVASLVGGALALISLRTPFYGELFVLLAAIPFALSLIEPPRHDKNGDTVVTPSMWSVIRQTMYERVEVKWLVLYSALVTTSTMAVVWFVQPYFALVGIPFAWYGVAWMTWQFSGAIFAIFAEQIEHWLGKRCAFMLLPFLSVAAYGVMAFSSSFAALGVIFLFQFVRGVSRPVLRDYINQAVGSEIRATVLSIQSFFGGFFFAVIGPIAGWIADTYTLQTTFAVEGCFFALIGTVALWRMRRLNLL